MTVDFTYPQTIDANTPATAIEVQANFDALLTWIKVNYRQKDDTPQLTVMPTLPGEPLVPQHAATKAYVDRAVPIATILEYAGTVLPDSFLWCDGSAYSETTEAALYDRIGTTYNTGGEPPDTFRVPDHRGRVGVGYDAAVAPFNVLGGRGGQRDGELLQHLHLQTPHHHTSAAHVHTSAAHVHPMPHTHTQHTSTIRADATGNVDYPVQAAAFYGFSSGTPLLVTGGVSTPNTSSTTPSDTGSATPPDTGDTTAVNENAGAGTTLVDKNLQPYLVCNFIIKAR